MNLRPELKLDWATHKAAKYAVENWHYSGCMPSGKLVKIGVWERDKFIGVVMFGRGASPYMAQHKGLKQTECAELVRIALNDHKTPVSRIVKIALTFLRKNSPGIKLVVSFADQSEGHHGGIYQAGNWVYTGITAPSNFYIIKGKKTHPRSLGAKGKEQSIKGARELDKNATIFRCEGKHRYMMAFDDEVYQRIILNKQPYPKREKQAMAVPSAQRRGSADLHAPKPKDSGEIFPTIKADAA